MTDTFTFHNGTFQHLILEGSPYEVGFTQGLLLKGSAQAAQAVREAGLNPEEHGFPAFSDLQKAYEALCPGINVELQGVADALAVPVERLAFYADSYNTPPHCAHMVALPAITADHHTYVGRSYELGLEDAELRLCTTRVQGKLAHIGFSGALFGRWDGLNSVGLSVTSSAGTSAGLPHEWIKVRGFTTWIAIRAILETCSTVQEALELLREAPTDYAHFIVADRAGCAALVEVAGAQRAVRQIDADGPAQYLFATNHYTLGDLPQWNTFEAVMGHSIPRYKAIEACIQQDIPHITPETFRRVLSREFPNGCFCPYYQYWLGTIRSMIFDLNAGQVEICFGAPGYNEWRTFTLAGDPGAFTYPAVFPQKG